MVCSLLRVKHCLILETGPPVGTGTGPPSPQTPAYPSPASFTADSAYTCPSVSSTSFWPASVRPLHGDAYGGKGETGGT